jgi:hypothetical protein
MARAGIIETKRIQALLESKAIRLEVEAPSMTPPDWFEG